MKHKLIKTENYLLTVDDSEIKEGDYHVAIRIVKTNGDKAIAFTDQEQLDAIAEIGGAKKIIAHLPLNNSLILQGVDLLPPLEQEDNAICPYPESKQNAVDWHNGYNKAKEKYKFTEEDIYKAIQYGREVHYTNDQPFIQSLSQPKMPTGFECEVESYTVGEMSKLPLGTRNEKIKTTTNPQGHTQWAGKYIY